MYFWYLTICEPIVHIYPIELPNRDSPGAPASPLFTQPDVTQRRTGNPGGEKAKPSSMQPLVAAVLPHVSTRNHAHKLATHRTRNVRRRWETTRTDAWWRCNTHRFT